jgi:hypothetical protein
MNPIRFEVKKTIKNSPKEICEKTLDVETWSSFDGHGFLPGIEKAEYKERTKEVVGSRIRVKNSDGTEHLEEILEYESGKRIVMKIYDFPTALSYVATHFIEEWNFEKLGKDETLVTRKFQLFPTSFLTRPLLSQIAAFMEKSIAKQLDEMAEDMGRS